MINTGDVEIGQLSGLPIHIVVVVVATGPVVAAVIRAVWPAVITAIIAPAVTVLTPVSGVPAVEVTAAMMAIPAVIAVATLPTTVLTPIVTIPRRSATVVTLPITIGVVARSTRFVGAELAVIGPPAVVATIPITAVVTTVLTAIRPLMVASILGKKTAVFPAGIVAACIISRSPRLKVAATRIGVPVADTSPSTWLVPAGSSLSCGPAALRAAVSLERFGIAFFLLLNGVFPSWSADSSARGDRHHYTQTAQCH